MKPQLLFPIVATFLCTAHAADSTAADATKNRLITAIEKDNRHPSKSDISGAWCSGPDLSGYTIQLEQRGQDVTGRGYYWGCLGTYDVFQVTGSYKSDRLRLTFTASPRKRVNLHLTYSELKGRPRFVERPGRDYPRIIPNLDVAGNP